jgi:hypothetical protein
MAESASLPNRPMTPEESDFASRVAELRPQVEALLEKYEVTLGVKMNYLNDAIIPTPTYVDTKPAKKDEKKD